MRTLKLPSVVFRSQPLPVWLSRGKGALETFRIPGECSPVFPYKPIREHEKLWRCITALPITQSVLSSGKKIILKCDSGSLGNLLGVGAGELNSPYLCPVTIPRVEIPSLWVHWGYWRFNSSPDTTLNVPDAPSSSGHTLQPVQERC